MTIDLQNLEKTELLKAKRTYSLAFTSGCFDLLHTGHIYLITKFRELIKDEAREVKLLIAIHSDSEVRLHKGLSRPIFKQEHRLILLDNIKGVDFVGVWDGWENIVELVFKLEPEYLLTTEDKASKQTWEDNWVNVAKKLGSKLLVIPKIESDISTSSLIDQIKLIK